MSEIITKSSTSPLEPQKQGQAQRVAQLPAGALARR